MELTTKHKIGSGIYGTVYLAMDEQGNVYAVKEQSQITLPELQAGFLNHPNLIKYVRVTPEIKIVCTPVGTSLHKIIPDVTLSMEDRISMIKDIISGLYHMHLNGFIHLDLHIENVIMTPNKRAVIIDFGLTMYGRNESDDEDNTYQLAELRSDLHNLGQIIYLLLTRQTTSYEIKQEAIKNTYILSRVPDHEFWASLTYDLMHKNINLNEVASIFKIEETLLSPQPLRLVKDLKQCYKEVMDSLNDPDFYWLPYYAVVYMTTIYATTDLTLFEATGLILDLYDSAERNPLSGADIVNRLIDCVRPIIIEDMDDAIRVHELISSGDDTYYALDLERTFDTPHTTLGQIIQYTE